jgi:hypothetical protein
MKQFFFLLLALPFSPVFGQKQTKPEGRRLQLGIIASPEVSYRYLKNLGGGAQTDQYITNNNKSERKKFGYAAGVSLCFQLNDYIGLEGGLQYANKGYQYKGYNYVTAINYQYLDIPAKVNFTFGQHKLRFIASAGLTTHIILAGKISDVQGDSDTGKPVKLDLSYYLIPNLSASVSAGIDYQINARSNFRVQPTFNHFLTKTARTQIGEYLWSAGMNFGYYFTF